MITSFQSYKVKIKDIPFKSEAGKTFPTTAAISFYSMSKNEIGYIEMAYLDTETIYNWIDQGKDICLDNCYIENFSLSNYRESRSLEKKSPVSLHNFSAVNTYFDSRDETDFSHAVFDDSYKNFENARFIHGAVSFQSADFKQGGINLSYVVFKDGNVDFSNIRFGNGEINFKNSWFGSGHKNFQYAQFGDGQALFVNTEFNDGDVSFINAEFGTGKVSFKIARFGEGKIDFHFSKFQSKDISFERTEFGDGKVDFRTVEFNSGKVNFNRSVFGKGEKLFEAIQLKKGRISFRKTDWGDGDINFEILELGDSKMIFDNGNFEKANLSFYNSQIKTLSLKGCHLDYYVDLRVARCELIDLSDVIARDIIDLKPHEFDVQIDTLNFSGMRLIGRIYIDWKMNRVLQIINSQKDTTNREKSEQYRILKENFNITGQYTDEDKSYVQFKRYEMKADLRDAIEKNPWSRIWEYPSYFFRWLVFDKVGLYATDPVRVLISMVFGYLFFTLLYLILPLIIDTKIVSSLGDPDKLSSISVAFYHSAITFLTIGYGDYYPSGVIRWISSIEGFTGLFLMSYFTVAFVRKILR